MGFIELIKTYKKQFTSHQPLIEVFVYKQNLLHNLHQYQSQYLNQQFAPVLKANAYGHGLEPVLRCLKKEKLPLVCVDSHFESRIVHKFCPNLACLVLGYCRLASIEQTAYRQSAFAITSLEQLQELSGGLNRPKVFHLKIDTGMFRQGVVKSQFETAVSLMERNQNIQLHGLFSHLACPEDAVATQRQIQEWNEAVKFFKKHFTNIKFWHLSASEGVRYLNKIDSNLVRLGIGFYGLSQATTGMDLKPALELYSMVTGTKAVLAGERIGYGYTFTAQQPMQIAVVPVGYFEGVDRRLSNQAGFFIQKTYCPIVGRVSMDMTTVDISSNKNIAFGDRVQVIGLDAKENNAILAWSKICQAIPYELLVKIPSQLARVVVE
jgi:alanine racemase